VLKGTSVDRGEYVAVKQIDKFMIDAVQLPGIKKEAEILKRLNHPNIVKIFAFVETPNTLYFVLEYVECGSLAGLLKKFGVFPEQLIASYTAQILQGLKYLHGEGIIHRDIKGDNILITKDGMVKLADFGTAKLEDAEKKTQTVVGTPYWMAPEVIEMSACGPTSDIWSVGCTVIELLTGAPPYFELGPMSALFNIVEDRHPPLPEKMSDDLRSFLKVCFKKDPRQRPTAAELLEHKWLKQLARDTNGDFDAVSGTLRMHNQPGAKKSVMSIFSPESGIDASSGLPAPSSSHAGSAKSSASSASKNAGVPPISHLSLSKNEANVSSSSTSNTNNIQSPRELKHSKRPSSGSGGSGGGSPRSSDGSTTSSGKPKKQQLSSSLDPQPSSASDSSSSSKKISSKLTRAKVSTEENQKAVTELQALYDAQKREKERIAKERARMEAQLEQLRREAQRAEAQMQGLQRVLKNVGLDSKNAKDATHIIRDIQEALGRDTYVKLSYGHLTRQNKCIRPAALLDCEEQRPRSGSI